MDIASFDDLLRAARAQPEPQRLLFVFAGAEAPEDASAGQRERFQAGQGGALVPLMSVDKIPEQLDSFDALVEESREFAQEWAIVFVAGLSGRGGCAPTEVEADQSLHRMVDAIKAGSFAAFLPFNRQGEPVLLSPDG